MRTRNRADHRFVEYFRVRLLGIFNLTCKTRIICGESNQRTKSCLFEFEMLASDDGRIAGNSKNQKNNKTFWCKCSGSRKCYTNVITKTYFEGLDYFKFGQDIEFRKCVVVWRMWTGFALITYVSTGRFFVVVFCFIFVY